MSSWTEASSVEGRMVEALRRVAPCRNVSAAWPKCISAAVRLVARIGSFARTSFDLSLYILQRSIPGLAHPTVRSAANTETMIPTFPPTIGSSCGRSSSALCKIECLIESTYPSTAFTSS